MYWHVDGKKKNVKKKKKTFMDSWLLQKTFIVRFKNITKVVGSFA